MLPLGHLAIAIRAAGIEDINKRPAAPFNHGHEAVEVWCNRLVAED